MHRSSDAPARTGQPGYRRCHPLTPETIFWQAWNYAFPSNRLISTAISSCHHPGHSNESREEIAAFDAGADDFIRRPLDPEIVFKRLRARLDFQANDGRSFANSKDNLIIDREVYAVYLNQQPVPVSRKELSCCT